MYLAPTSLFHSSHHILHNVGIETMRTPDLHDFSKLQRCDTGPCTCLGVEQLSNVLTVPCLYQLRELLVGDLERKCCVEIMFYMEFLMIFKPVFMRNSAME